MRIAALLALALALLALTWPASAAPSCSLTDQIVERFSHERGFSSLLVREIIAGESSFVDNARGSAGELGWMQLSEGAWNFTTNELMGVDWPFAVYAVQPEYNVNVGTRYLAYARQVLAGRGYFAEDELLVGYNAGPEYAANLFDAGVFPRAYPRFIHGTISRFELTGDVC